MAHAERGPMMTRQRPLLLHALRVPYGGMTYRSPEMTRGGHARVGLSRTTTALLLPGRGLATASAMVA